MMAEDRVWNILNPQQAEIFAARERIARLEAILRDLLNASHAVWPDLRGVARHSVSEEFMTRAREALKP
jgi:hypothetical protein